MANKKINTVHNKKKMLEALQKTLGIVTTACKICNISRTQFYIWYKEDEKFREDVESVEGMALDFAESKLLENIKERKETSIIFYLKTKGRKRGYAERTEHVVETIAPVLSKEDRKKRLKELRDKASE